MAENPCPVGCCAEIISGKWTLLVIRDLADGSRRFCELERSLEGISPRTLSLRLRALEDQGIVLRRTYPEVPPRVEYALTKKGRALVPLIEDMRAYVRFFFSSRRRHTRSLRDWTSDVCSSDLVLRGQDLAARVRRRRPELVAPKN